MKKLKKTPQKQQKRKVSNTPEAKFQREWQRVQNFKQRNDKLRSQLDTLIDTVSPQVKDSEILRLERVYALCQHLAGYLTRRTLPEYLRETLFDWIRDNYDEIHFNPFVDMQPELARLDACLHAQCETLDEYAQEKYEKRLLKQGITQEALDEAKQQVDDALKQAQSEQGSPTDPQSNEDMFADLFEEFDFTEEDGAKDDMGFWDELFDEDLNDFIDPQKAKGQELDQLLKATPIHKLFRKITRVLHPDLEQNEDKKSEKTRLMSELVEARDQKDVPTIIQMYSDHVGELPEGFFEGNFEKLTNLLKYQVERLKDENEMILAEDSSKTMVYEMFGGKTDRDIQKNIQQFLKQNDSRIAAVTSIRQDITSVARLRLYLEERLKEQAMPSFEDYY